MTRNRRRHKDDPKSISPTQINIENMRRENGENIAEFINYLENEIEKADDSVDRYLFRSELQKQYRILGDRAAEERLLLEETSLQPNNSLSWTRLASFYWLVTSDFNEAIRAAKRAARTAQEQRLLVIASYNSLAHIARDAGDYATLSTCLEAIMDYERPDGPLRDIRYERTFLRGVPAGAIDPELRARYGAFMRRSGHLRDYRPHQAIERFWPVSVLVRQGKAKELGHDLLERAEIARYLVRDMKGVPERIIGGDDVEAALLDLSRVIGTQLSLIKGIIIEIEDDRLAFGIDEAERLAWEKFKTVKGRYFRRHGREELNRYLASMRTGEFDDW